MKPSGSSDCTRCGAAIPGGTTDPLCPACLMSEALKAPADTTAPMAGGQPASAPVPTSFPCEFGGYRLLKLLGAGGMGRVCEAEQLATGRRVALKMLQARFDSPDVRHRFLREGRLAAGVSHPNSLYVFGSEEIEGTPVITMEIAGGGTLRDTLKKRGPLPVTDAVDAILDVVSGLEAAFVGGVLHRDVKPSNCFVGPDGTVKVGDFGLSVSMLAGDDSYVTATGVIMGTPAYAPPEQLRGDELDVRADIYSVGATLFTLLTGRAPFEGKNAVQVVANAMQQKPTPLSELRDDVPHALERVVTRCLSKEPEGRYSNYMALRNALLPFSSAEPEPASIKARASAGWIDYLIAFLIPYVILMLSIGNEAFHFRLFFQRTLDSARHHLVFLGLGLLYFSIAEGIWGAGLGKRLKGLRVVRADGRPPGIGRALIRILIPVLCIEAVRIPLLMASISATDVNRLTIHEVVLYSVATSFCPLIPMLFVLPARRENGFATVWDLASGTRVVIKPKGVVRPSIESATRPEPPATRGDWLGPFRITEPMVPGKWIVATDPVLRRRVWLLRRTSSGLSRARRDLGRPGRLRWLQEVETAESTWDAFEATPGVPLSRLVQDGNRVPWGKLRHWLHDLAAELWAASGDDTLPAELSLDHIWITKSGQAVLLDEPWPKANTRAEGIPVGDLAGQQRFLNTVAARVESTSLPLHARPVLRNLGEGRFEKLSFLTGTLRGLLDKPTEVGKAIRAGSIFLLPLYVWIMVLVGISSADRYWHSASQTFLAFALLVLVAGSLFQLVAITLSRTTGGHATFGLVVVDAKGQRAGRSTLLRRWAIVWLPLMLPMGFLVPGLQKADGVAAVCALVLLLLWLGIAFHAVMHPNRGWHDRLADTWVVRR